MLDERTTGKKTITKMIIFERTTAAASKGEIIEDVTYSQYRVEVFDRNGYSMASSWYKSNEELLCEYDEQGNLLELGVLTYGKAFPRFGFEYDDSFNLIRLVQHQGGFEFIDDLVYDDNARLIQILRSPVTRSKGKTVFVYDEMGNIIEEVRFDWQDMTETKRTFQHNDSGNMVEEKYYTYCGSGEDGFQLNGFIKYDNSGNRTEDTYYACCCCGCCDPSTGDLKTHINKYTYTACNEHGNWTKRYREKQIIDISGETLDENISAEYRTITYYQQ
ncbi:MAG: hypothetical protein GY845_12560 [Planctomycetes bacterium]|nr:hypothetical protein [Planctomycetota bacterium]